MQVAFLGFSFAIGLVLACLQFAAGYATAGSSRKPTDAQLNELHERKTELYRAGKYREAIPLAKRYVEGTKARVGPNHPAHAAALNDLAALLEETNQLSEA